jgi:hypothetical protein
MATVVLDPYAYELDALKERRRASGLDRLDERGAGVLHMAPAPNYRHASIEVQELPFYAAHDVEELLIVDPETCTVRWLGLTGGEYRPLERSGLIDLGGDELTQRIAWPR